ncbi:scavenger receptor cysteine-rich type 1 protein M130-like [Salminus brasiliensis]|uniref:scavenger receptor cysteine-rich type 1 protein M130-like n=1 Tax=Salminus brasiliensis TaxID=930266 RepID=UPI003B833432
MPSSGLLMMMLLMVICSTAEEFNIQLVGGNSRCSGTLAFFEDGQWVNVSSNTFNLRAAMVLCRGLDCGNVLSVTTENITSFSFEFFIFCKGQESAINECEIFWTLSFQNYTTAIVCSDSVRLVDGPGLCSGRVEVKPHQSWTTVCEADFDWQDAEVVCRELGCGPPLIPPGAHFGEGKHPFGTEEFQCKGTERHLLNCSTSATCFTTVEPRLDKTSWAFVIVCVGSEASLRECVHLKKAQAEFLATVNCSDSVRLVDGAGLCSGRVEVKPHQSWTTVCEADFDWPDAEVVCRELGCGTPLTLQGALFGEGNHPFGTKEFQCKGIEKSLCTCSTSDKKKHLCSRGNAVGLTCSEPDDVRLVDGHSCCDGTVEWFHNGEWRRVTGYHWDKEAAAVVCRQLNCGSVVVMSRVEAGRNEADKGVFVQCVGSESALRECPVELDTFRGHVAVICSGVLGKPTISLSTAIRDPHRPQAFRGHIFTITCSTQPQFPGGSFHLKLPWANRSLSQTAVNHSAAFVFPDADDSHQGNYSCIYENKGIFENISLNVYPETFIHNFSSESELLYLTITDSPLPATISRMLLVPSLLLMSCLLIFLIFKKWGHTLIRNPSGQQGAAAAAVQYDIFELVSLQPSAEEQQNMERGSGEKQPADLEQEEEEEQARN